MNGFMGSVVAILGLLAGVATIAALVSPKAQTAALIGSTFSGFSGGLAVALSPLTGVGGGSNFGSPASAYQTF